MSGGSNSSSSSSAAPQRRLKRRIITGGPEDEFPAATSAAAPPVILTATAAAAAAARTATAAETAAATAVAEEEEEEEDQDDEEQRERLPLESEALLRQLVYQLQGSLQHSRREVGRLQQQCEQQQREAAAAAERQEAVLAVWGALQTSLLLLQGRVSSRIDRERLRCLLRRPERSLLLGRGRAAQRRAGKEAEGAQQQEPCSSRKRTADQSSSQSPAAPSEAVAKPRVAAALAEGEVAAAGEGEGAAAAGEGKGAAAGAGGEEERAAGWKDFFSSTSSETTDSDDEEEEEVFHEKLEKENRQQQQLRKVAGSPCSSNSRQQRANLSSKRSRLAFERKLQQQSQSTQQLLQDLVLAVETGACAEALKQQFQEEHHAETSSSNSHESSSSSSNRERSSNHDGSSSSHESSGDRGSNSRGSNHDSSSSSSCESSSSSHESSNKFFGSTERDKGESRQRRRSGAGCLSFAEEDVKRESGLADSQRTQKVTQQQQPSSGDSTAEGGIAEGEEQSSSLMWGGSRGKDVKSLIEEVKTSDLSIAAEAEQTNLRRDGKRQREGEEVKLNECWIDSLQHASLLRLRRRVGVYRQRARTAEKRLEEKTQEVAGLEVEIDRLNKQVTLIRYRMQVRAGGDPTALLLEAAAAAVARLRHSEASKIGGDSVPAAVAAAAAAAARTLAKQEAMTAAAALLSEPSTGGDSSIDHTAAPAAAGRRRQTSSAVSAVLLPDGEEGTALRGGAAGAEEKEAIAAAAAGSSHQRHTAARGRENENVDNSSSSAVLRALLAALQGAAGSQIPAAAAAAVSIDKSFLHRHSETFEEQKTHATAADDVEPHDMVAQIKLLDQQLVSLQEERDRLQVAAADVQILKALSRDMILHSPPYLELQRDAAQLAEALTARTAELEELRRELLLEQSQKDGQFESLLGTTREQREELLRKIRELTEEAASLRQERDRIFCEREKLKDEVRALRTWEKEQEVVAGQRCAQLSKLKLQHEQLKNAGAQMLQRNERMRKEKQQLIEALRQREDMLHQLQLRSVAAERAGAAAAAAAASTAGDAAAAGGAAAAARGATAAAAGGTGETGASGGEEEVSWKKEAKVKQQSAEDEVPAAAADEAGGTAETPAAVCEGELRVEEEVGKLKRENEALRLKLNDYDELDAEMAVLREQYNRVSEEVDEVSKAFEERHAYCEHLLRQLKEREEALLELRNRSCNFVQQQQMLQRLTHLHKQKLLLLRQQYEQSSSNCRAYAEALQQANTRASLADQQRDELALCCQQIQTAREGLFKEKEEALSKLAAALDANKALDAVAQESVARRSAAETALRKARHVTVELERKIEKMKAKEEKLLKRKAAQTAAQEEISSKDVHLLEEENETMRRRLLCSVCTERFKDHIINKCGHMYCYTCLERNVKTRNRKCPHCSKPTALPSTLYNNHAFYIKKEKFEGAIT